ncbi:helix-turn-helix transcriptional regulator [Natrialba taiwanensis]|uniref:HTH cro/C1-type domain-containing protein n=1 Tax=Natrialba taiwanensis DSM 12281 TaxID=1230458 RepID=L9ZNV8_9EURY|nr:helix-turn-helix transcriptional regulator [Natrialba taiwanensis]ELY87242.1 hypothetical protein C484_17816 [Natrialba taiwanensis DSM 12281]
MIVENDLKSYRDKEGITQEKLAAEVGVSRQTINAIETRKYNPSLELALSLANWFNTSVEDLFWIYNNG